MKLKKSLLFIATVLSLSSQITHAQIIPLDYKDPIHCRQQLLGSPDHFPVVVSYFHDCHWAQEFLPKFLKVAKKHPERTFFTFDFQDEKRHEVASLCLQQVAPIPSPIVYVMQIKQDPDTRKKFITAPVRVGAEGRSTEEDVEKLIDMK